MGSIGCLIIKSGVPSLSHPSVACPSSMEYGRARWFLDSSFLLCFYLFIILAISYLPCTWPPSPPVSHDFLFLFLFSFLFLFPHFFFGDARHVAFSDVNGGRHLPRAHSHHHLHVGHWRRLINQDGDLVSYLRGSRHHPWSSLIACLRDRE